MGVGRMSGNGMLMPVGERSASTNTLATSYIQQLVCLCRHRALVLCSWVRGCNPPSYRPAAQPLMPHSIPRHVHPSCSMKSPCAVPPHVHLPASRHSSIFRVSSAGIELSKGRLMPSASMAEAMVLAVYMPPHAPAPASSGFPQLACKQQMA